MISLDDFGAALGIEEEYLADAHAIFCEELAGPQKTLAARAADLAHGLRGLGVPEETVSAAVCQLRMERRR